jgi:uncharacterized membrane protein YeaQ/YmgE (transglycosylase-associated protein family)
MLWTIIVILVGGVIIGLLGKLLAPGDRDNIPFWLTVVCGIVGMIVGNMLYYAIFKDSPNDKWDNMTKGVDWWRHVWQVVVAALAVMAASFATGRSGRSGRRA